MSDLDTLTALGPWASFHRIALVVGLCRVPPEGLQSARRYVVGVRNHRRFSGYWELPGGKMEPGEAPIAAIQREWLEEFGVEVPSEARVCPFGLVVPVFWEPDPPALCDVTVVCWDGTVPQPGGVHSVTDTSTLAWLARSVPASPVTPVTMAIAQSAALWER